MHRVSYHDSAYAAAQGADALLILTDWSGFANLDLERLRSMLAYPIVVDGRNLYDPATMSAHGFLYYSIGRPDAQPTRHAEKYRVEPLHVGVSEHSMRPSTHVSASNTRI